MPPQEMACVFSLSSNLVALAPSIEKSVTQIGIPIVANVCHTTAIG